MKLRHVPVIVSVVAALLIAAFLPASAALAIPAPEPEAGRPKSQSDAFWTSGWVDIATGEPILFYHNMGGDITDYSIQLWFRDADAGGYGINNRAYGGDEDNGVWLGAFWRSLDNTTISVARQLADVMADQVRVWIWPSEADLEYCTTGWSPIAPNTTVTVNHNLGGNVDDYAVKLWFRTPSLNGVHQIYYGGAEGGGHQYGAYWHGLDAAQVQVTRLADDTEVDEFYLCVTVPDPPDWDSGWTPLDPGEAVVLNHNLGVNINRYIVRMELKQAPEEGSPEAPMLIHQFGYGGIASNVLKDAQYLGANWQNLTNQNISVYRWADDPYADQIRVRIWLRRLSVYLPVVFRNYP